jgi:hypothetical protein
MLLGFFVTLFWIPGNEHGAEGEIKTLEDWEVGRESNEFDKAWLAKMIVPVYHKAAKIWDRFYLWLDKITDGDLAERRQREAEEIQVMQEMQEMQEAEEERD